MAKTPYLSVDVHDLEAFTWTLPDATTARPFTTGLERSMPRAGESVMVLSGPREDVTASITDSAAVSKVWLEPGAPATRARGSCACGVVACLLSARGQNNCTTLSGGEPS